MVSLKTSLQVFSNRAYTLFWVGGFLSTLGIFMQSVAVGWQVYAIARQTYSIEQSSFLVGMVGLVQFLPLFALALIAGEMTDRYDRRKIILLSSGLQLVSAVALTLVAALPNPSLVAIFCIATLVGVSRAFIRPARTALGPMLVSPVLLPRAIAWNSLSMQAGMVLGPWLGGLLCASSAMHAYAAATVLYVFSAIAFYFMRGATKPDFQGGSRMEMIREGLHYVWSNKLVFGAISLDLFAVLLGGVTALLPVYARDILQIGADGFGLLRSGPAIGGGIMAVILGFVPIQHHAGRWMLGAVAVYGLATLAFATSKNIAFSMAMLITLGAADVISVFVRQTLIQVTTPDAMRGRVSAVSTLFISASNELGEFESGVAARFFGPVGAVIFGGIGSLAVVAIWSRLFPALRDADRLVKED